MAAPGSPRTAAELIVQCLENEGVTHVFGIPGEENIRLVEAIPRSKIPTRCRDRLPVDYSANLDLIESLGELDESLT